MAVRIRFARMGTKKKPFYRLVAADSEAPRDGKFIEILGTYDPKKDPAEVVIHRSKVSHWLEKGARVSESARTILKKEGLLNAPWNVVLGAVEVNSRMEGYGHERPDYLHWIVLSEVSPEKLLLLGKVVRPHGLAGLLKVWSYAQSEESFLKAGRVFLKSDDGEFQEFTIISITPHKKTFLLKLKEMISLREAEGYRGAEIYVSRSALSHDREDEYFWFDLIGMRVFSDQGDYVGTIEQILSTAAHDLYVARKGDNEILIPAIHEVVEKIDIENRKMTISPMRGLLDLNEI